VYGWTLNPIVEYYIVEYSVNPSSFGIQKGSVISDGANYTIWENIPINAPPIEGTTTFHQYYSVRNTPRTEGTVTVENHFNAWLSLGLDLGTLNYQIVAVEAWQGSGSASYSVSN
jgi:endo-1,4-beta-xylanase